MKNHNSGATACVFHPAAAAWPLLRRSGSHSADLTNIITNGKGKMPKYDGKLTRLEVFLSALSRPQVP